MADISESHYGASPEPALPSPFSKKQVWESFKDDMRKPDAKPPLFGSLPIKGGVKTATSSEYREQQWQKAKDGAHQARDFGRAFRHNPVKAWRENREKIGKAREKLRNVRNDFREIRAKAKEFHQLREQAKKAGKLKEFTGEALGKFGADVAQALLPPEEMKKLHEADRKIKQFREGRDKVRAEWNRVKTKYAAWAAAKQPAEAVTSAATQKCPKAGGGGAASSSGSSSGSSPSDLYQGG